MSPVHYKLRQLGIILVLLNITDNIVKYQQHVLIELPLHRFR